MDTIVLYFAIGLLITAVITGVVEFIKMVIEDIDSLYYYPVFREKKQGRSRKRRRH